MDFGLRKVRWDRTARGSRVWIEGVKRERRVRDPSYFNLFFLKTVAQTHTENLRSKSRYRDGETLKWWVVSTTFWRVVFIIQLNVFTKKITNHRILKIFLALKDIPYPQLSIPSLQMYSQQPSSVHSTHSGHHDMSGGGGGGGGPGSVPAGYGGQQMLQGTVVIDWRGGYGRNTVDSPSCSLIDCWAWYGRDTVGSLWCRVRWFIDCRAGAWLRYGRGTVDIRSCRVRWLLIFQESVEITTVSMTGKPCSHHANCMTLGWLGHYIGSKGRSVFWNQWNFHGNSKIQSPGRCVLHGHYNAPGRAL